MTRTIVDCTHCGKRHFSGSAAQKECQNKSTGAHLRSAGKASVVHSEMSMTTTLDSPRTTAVTDSVNSMDNLIDALDSGDFDITVMNSVNESLGRYGATLEQRSAAFRLYHGLSMSPEDRETVAQGLDESISRLSGDEDRSDDLVYNVTAAQVMDSDTIVVFDHEGNPSTHQVKSVDKETDLSFREHSRIVTTDGEEFYLPAKKGVDVIHSPRKVTDHHAESSQVNRSSEIAASDMSRRINARGGDDPGYKPRHLYAALLNSHRDIPVSRVSGRESVTSYRSDGGSIRMTPATRENSPAVKVEEFDAAGIPVENSSRLMSMSEKDVQFTMSRIISWERGMNLR